MAPVTGLVLGPAWAQEPPPTPRTQIRGRQQQQHKCRQQHRDSTERDAPQGSCQSQTISLTTLPTRSPSIGSVSSFGES